MLILFISDNDETGNRLAAELMKMNQELKRVRTDDDLLALVCDQKPNVLLVDLESPSRELVGVCRNVIKKSRFDDIRLVVACPREKLSQIDVGWGIDDLVVAPVDAVELDTRLRLHQWHTQRINGEDVLEIGNLKIGMDRREVRVENRPVVLTFQEYQLLTFLATHRGRVYSRDELLVHVWGYEYYGGTRTVDVHIRRIRSKIGDEMSAMIETVRSVGYRFRE